MTQKSILITGVDEGIGYETSQYFLEQGWMVFGSMLASAFDETLFSQYPDFVPLTLDVTDQSSIDKALKHVEDKLDGQYLSCLYNNAAVVSAGHIAIESLEDMQHLMDVNYWGVVRMIRACLPLLGSDPQRAGSKGRIINPGSVSAVMPYPTGSSHAASKAALLLLSRSLSVELAPVNVPVTYLDMGAVETKAVGRAHDCLVNGEDAHFNSPYKKLYQGTMHLYNSMLHDGSDDKPRVIAEEIYQLACKAKPPAYQSASQLKAKLGAMLLYLLPHNVTNAIVNLLLARAMKQVAV